jgi:hypothetical protein
MFQSVVIPILILFFGFVLMISGVRIWIRKTAKFADPLLWGPLTGGLGTLVVASIFGDAEIKGIAARVLALFQLGLGLLCIVMVISNHFGAKRYAEVQARNAAKTAKVEAARQEGTQQISSLPLLAPPSQTKAVAAAEPPSAPTPLPSAPQATAPAPASPPEAHKPASIEPMPKGWLPEGVQRR